MKGPRLSFFLIFVSAVFFFATGCSKEASESLSVTGGLPVTYRSATGETIVARYYELTDGSLSFVKLTLPDGERCTLPQVLSGSGVRYTDDFRVVWWTKGDTAFGEARDGNGDWKLRYPDCRIVEGQGEKE